MPVKKNTSAARKKPAAKKLTSREEDALMEFESFVSQKPASSNKGKSWLAMTLLVLIIILGAIWIFMSNTNTVEKDNKFKAVYLDNGQVYYAKVVKEDALNVYLDQVYYIQIEQQLVTPEPVEGEEEEEPEPQVVEVPVLVKRGQELHRPEGLMQINRSKLVAIEEIGQDSQILTEIQRVSAQQ